MWGIVKAQDIARLMSEILDIDDIETTDNFFEIGGNSILALTLIEEVWKRCQARISLLSFIRSPTPDGLALLVAHDGAPKAQ